MLALLAYLVLSLNVSSKILNGRVSYELESVVCIRVYHPILGPLISSHCPSDQVCALGLVVKVFIIRLPPFVMLQSWSYFLIKVMECSCFISP